jgi:hypothetical protein
MAFSEAIRTKLASQEPVADVEGIARFFRLAVQGSL